MGTKRFLTDTKYKLVVQFFHEIEKGCCCSTYEYYSNNKRFLKGVLSRFKTDSYFSYGIIFNLEDK